MHCTIRIIDQLPAEAAYLRARKRETGHGRRRTHMVDIHAPSEINCSIEIVFVPRMHLNNFHVIPQATLEFYLNDCALHLCDEIHHEG